MNNRHTLEQAIANAGPMSPAQRRAMWAKRNGSASQPPPVKMTAPDGTGHFVQQVALPPMNSTPAAPSQKPPRQWGESRPGELYVQVEGPGNPAWEKRHPELAPSGSSVAPPQHHLLDAPPPTKTPRVTPDLPYGSDARTAPTPGHPDPDHPYQTPPFIPEKSKAKKPIRKVNDWYKRG